MIEMMIPVDVVAVAAAGWLLFIRYGTDTVNVSGIASDRSRPCNK